MARNVHLIAFFFYQLAFRSFHQIFVVSMTTAYIFFTFSPHLTECVCLSDKQ